MLEEFIEQLNNTTTINAGDMIVVEKDPGGAPETMNMLWSDVQDSIVYFQNYQIVPSVASNTLTVAIKDLSGNDATVSKQIKFKVGNTIYGLAGASSIVAPAGTHWCNLGSAELAGKATDLFLYAVGETGAGAGLKFGFSRIPYARTMADFSSTFSNEKYLAWNGINRNATDAVSVIGRFRAQLSAGASYNWSIASSVVVNRPIYETDWLLFAPGVVANTGTITTLGTVSAVYQVIGRNMNVEFAATITTNGTGAGSIYIGCPFTFAGMSHYGAGRENNVVGGMLQVITLPGSTNLYVITAANAYPGGSGYNVSGSISLAPII